MTPADFNRPRCLEIFDIFEFNSFEIRETLCSPFERRYTTFSLIGCPNARKMSDFLSSWAIDELLISIFTPYLTKW